MDDILAAIMELNPKDALGILQYETISEAHYHRGESFDALIIAKSLGHTDAADKIKAALQSLTARISGPQAPTCSSSVLSPPLEEGIRAPVAPGAFFHSSSLPCSSMDLTPSAPTKRPEDESSGDDVLDDVLYDACDAMSWTPNGYSRNE